MKEAIGSVIIALMLVSFPVIAEHNGVAHSHENMPTADKPLVLPDVKLSSNEVLLEVHGIVCSFCSKGVQNKIGALSFVDTTKYIKGTLVEIESQRVIVAIKPGLQANISELFDAVKSGGYDPVAAYKLNEKKVLTKIK